MPSAEAIREVIERYFSAIQALDVEAWVATFAKDAVNRDPVDGPATKGHDALRAFFRNIAQAFKRLRMAPDHVFVTGQGAAVKWTARGVAHNGREVVFEGIDVFESIRRG